MVRAGVRTQRTLLHKTDCACTAVRRAARSTTQLYDLVLAPTGLKTTQFVALRAIDAHGEIAQFELAGQYAVAAETLSRRLSTMRKAGWIQLRAAADHNARLYSLTPAGKRILETARPYWARAQERLANILGSEEKLLELISSLDALTNAASAAATLRIVNTNHSSHDSGEHLLGGRVDPQSSKRLPN